jgi:hypothetical protein
MATTAYVHPNQITAWKAQLEGGAANVFGGAGVRLPSFRAWGETHGLPTIVTNCSNNYGPDHDPEKLIPHMIVKVLEGAALPIYGDGMSVRGWLFVGGSRAGARACARSRW